MFNISYILGGQELKKEVTLSNVSVTKGHPVAAVSGYASNAYATLYTSLMIGVAQETVDNSGGSAGDKTCLVELNPHAVYIVDTSDTMAVAYQWGNVASGAIGTVVSNTLVSAKTGYCKLMQMISTSKAYGRINFASPTEAA